MKELTALYATQPYLLTLYRALFCTAYFGLLRIGEVTKSSHTLKAADVHIGTNKNKLLLILHSSKTHTKGDIPQMIKIASMPQTQKHADKVNWTNRGLCPFTFMKMYLEIRLSSLNIHEEFFVFSDRSPVLPAQARNLLNTVIGRLGLDSSLYTFHGLEDGQSGRSVEIWTFS